MQYNPLSRKEATDYYKNIEKYDTESFQTFFRKFHTNCQVELNRSSCESGFSLLGGMGKVCPQPKICSSPPIGKIPPVDSPPPHQIFIAPTNNNFQVVTQ